MSEQKRYTAQEMREAAEGLLTPSASIFYIEGFKTRTYDYADILNMLRQAADTEDELSHLKARLDAVVGMLENVDHECRYTNSVSMTRYEFDTILRAACGESEVAE